MKTDKIDEIMTFAGKVEPHQKIREVVRVGGVDMFEPCTDPNVTTLVSEYDSWDDVPENRRKDYEKQ